MGVSRIPDLVLSSDEGESDSDDDEDLNQTIVQPSLYSTPQRLPSCSTPTGPPPARVTGPPFAPIPFNLSLNLSPGPAFPPTPPFHQLVQDDNQEAAPAQQGGADRIQPAAPVLEDGAGQHVQADAVQPDLPAQATPGRREQLHLAGHHAAQLAGRVSEWELQ